MTIVEVIKGIIQSKKEKFATFEEIQYAMRKQRM